MKEFLRNLAERIGAGKRDRRPFTMLFKEFKEILEINTEVLELIADTNDKLSGDYIFDQHYIETVSRDICDRVEKMIYGLDTLVQHHYPDLHAVFLQIREEIEDELLPRKRKVSTEFVLPLCHMSKDNSETVGSKNANLAELNNVLRLRVPDGFGVTASAYHAFLEYNELPFFIEKTVNDWQQGEYTPAEASKRIRRHILAGALPKKLRRDLKTACDRIEKRKGTQSFALRSSALGEDSAYSFAGQHTSEINVERDRIEEAYKHVLASLYSESALIYRHWKGFKESETAMPVICQQTIDAAVSGVMYTYDPQDPKAETLLIDATWGLGGLIVSGEVRADQFVVDRNDPTRVLAAKPVRKDRMLKPLPSGGTTEEPVSRSLQERACLTPEQVTEIAGAGLVIERYFKKPQDIEFAIDQGGQLVILQTRPLMIRPYESSRPADLAEVTGKYEIVMQGKGDVAQKGIALGPVFIVRQEKDLQEFPEGAILVTHYASPLYAKVLDRAAGIITDVGSPSGHLATIARESRIPAIVNCEGATKTFENGMEITMDAEENVIYAGLINELKYYSLSQEPIEETFEYRLLRRILKKIEPLHLLDPSEKDFVPASCTSLHDISRFVHEKAVEALVDFHFYHHRATDPDTAKLVWDIPLDLVLIDIGGGIRAGAGKKINVGEVESLPMQAIIKGLSIPGAWDNEPLSVDFGSFMSSLTRTISPELATPKHLGQNLAVISDDYANISLRVGYHFTMIDTYLTENLNDNYIYFRFFGGVTDELRRTRRARFLSRILAENDFRVELHGDFVVGRIKKLGRQGIIQRLNLLGLLIGYTRQLDIKMINEERIADNVNRFKILMEGGYE